LTEVEEGGDNRGWGRAAAAITAWNVVSRATGFARVVAMAAALGATPLGDTYQSANLVSNILFELLAGGMLSAVLVPAFVQRLDRGDRAGAQRLAGGLLAVAWVGLGAIVLAAMAAAPWVMRLLTLGVDNAAVRDAQVELGRFLLLFFLPQVLLYATGAIATALLAAQHRFVAAAAAPVLNNLVVIGIMVAFRARVDGDTALELDTGAKLLLALGTTAGVLAMTALPLLALRGQGGLLRPRWPSQPEERGELAAVGRRGLWAAGHLGLNQLLVAVTIVLAARVAGGVVAFQVAFTFFLLPHAVLANPIFTVLFPRLAADAAGGRLDTFATDLGRGLRTIALLLLPAAGLMAALALPALETVRLGALDADGAELVASVLAAYAAGLVGYSGFFLLTRAAYALDDVRTPTTVNGVATALGVVGMLVASAMADGDGKVVALGVVHSVVVTIAAVLLLARVQARLGRSLDLGGALLRAALAAAGAALLAWWTARAIGTASRGDAVLALAAGGAVGAGAYALASPLWSSGRRAREAAP
jgi:putative peptidoglycan lipid II flippase